MSDFYEFSFVGGNENSYIFLTDYSIFYEIKFKNSDYLLDVIISDDINNLIFEFVIDVLENPNKSKVPLDNKIGLTVAHIFNDFFIKNNNAISIYICDSSDAKQEIRMKKFDQWYYKYQDSTFLKIDEVLVDSKKKRYPISLILKNTNPYRLQIFDAFVNITKLQNQAK